LAGNVSEMTYFVSGET